MNTTTTRRKLNTTKVLSIAQPPIASSAHKLGGWVDPGKEEDKAHYFVAVDEPGEDGQVPCTALCGIGDGMAHVDELVPSDHMAPENCKHCRRIVLEQAGLI